MTTTRVPVIVCPSCEGMTFTLESCRCTYSGDQLLVGESSTSGDVEPTPYRDCRVCRGVGSVARACHGCGQTGRRRAQLVLTVANLDTGQVSSASIVPGTLTPMLWSDGMSWHLPVAPVIRDLAAAVGAASWTDAANPPRSSDGPVIFLPRQWRPDLPEIARRAMEAEALAWQSTNPWYVYLGRVDPAPPRDPRRELGRLCQLADLLCLDLVVEARREPPGWSWDIRYEMPGSPVPDRVRGWAETLTGAIAATSVTDALDGLAARGLTAPAHHLMTDGSQPGEGVVPAMDLAELDRRVLGCCHDLDTGDELPGGQGVWRDGRWWYTGLRIAGTVETLTERRTGQIVRQRQIRLRRAWQPPAPARLGPAIPHSVCPDCRPHNRLRACLCTLGQQPAAPDCPHCRGAGYRPSALPCHTCADSRQIHHGASVTITDLRRRAVHLTWRADRTADHASDTAVDTASDRPRIIASQPGGKPIHQLPDRFRLARWAERFGVRPEDLTDTYGQTIRQDLRDGIVTTDHPGNNPIVRHLNLATKGQPAARIIIVAVPPDTPSLAQTVRTVRGLGLAATVTLVDHHLNADDPRKIHGESWDLTVSNADQDGAPDQVATRPTPEQAVASCLEYLELALAAAVSADPDQPVPVPRTPTPYPIEDPTPLVRRLARLHAGCPVAVRYDDTGCHLWVHEGRSGRHLASAPTLPAALAALDLDRH